MNDLHPAVPAQEQLRSWRPGPGVDDAAGRAFRPRAASARDVLVLVFYHSRLIVFCVLLGLVLGIVGAALSTARFTADALILVLVGQNAMSAQDAAGISQTVISIDGLKVVQSEMQIIQNAQVLRSAVQQVGATVMYPGLARPRWFGLRPPRPEALRVGEAMQRLREDLRVEAETGSNIVRISYAHPDRTVAKNVVQAVLDAYLTQRHAIHSDASATFLSQEIARYRSMLGTLDNEIQELRNHYSVLDMAQDIVLATDRLDGIVQRQNQVRERKVAVETEIVAVKANLAQQPDTVLDFRETTNNTGNDEARNTLVRLEQERTHLLNQFNPSWPAIDEINKKIATARSEMGSKAGNLYFSERRIRNPAIDLLNNRLASLQVENQALGQQLSELEDQYTQAANRIATLREADGKLHSLQLSRDVSEGVYRQLVQKQPAAMLQDKLSNDPNASLRVVQPATAPVTGRSMAISYVLGGAFLGLLLGAAVAAIATMLRRVYIAPSEAERDLALPALAAFDVTARKGELEHHPVVSQLGALLQDVTVDGRRLSSLQLMGLSPGDDRAALVQALAVELATGHERETLIIDLEGDGVLYAAALGRGEPAAPAGTLPPPLPIVPTQVPRLWVTTGTVQPILHDWRSSIGRLRGLLDELRQQFGMLLVIAPAQLSGQAVHRLASLVDANVAIVRAEHTRGPVAQHLRDTIQAAGGNMLGFIFVGRKYYVPRWLLRWV